jgi:GTPase involved in cell partitioning and DNA repair
VLVYVIDVNDEDIAETRQILEDELSAFDSSLTARPSITVITKIDTLPESDLKQVSAKLPREYIYISAVAGTGTDKYLQAIEKELDQQRAKTTTD